MVRKTFACCLLAGLAALAALAQTAAPTADELIEKNIQAKGGREKLKSVQSVRFTGKMVMGQGMEAPVTMEMLPPAKKVRLDFTLQGMTGTQAYDGKIGWQIMPFLGKNDPEQMTGDELKDIQEEADFQGPLFDYKDKGNQVEYLGKGDLEGTPVHKLKLTEKNGNVSTIYLDAETYLELKHESTRTIRGQSMDLETTLGDYKKVEGLTLPHTIETKPKGAPAGQTITLQKIEVNSGVAADRFDMPKVEKKPSAPPKPN